MSGRDRDRERDRRAAAQPQHVRMSILFPRTVLTERSLLLTSVGILGTMLSYGLATTRLVCAEKYARLILSQNPQTRQIQQGYFITAYRNLTTAMIADLKADSERWDAERRQTASRGQPSNGITFRDTDGIVRKSNTPIVEYRASTTHQSRQYYGPTEAAPGMATAGYPQGGATAGGGAQQGVYDPGYGASGYAQPAGGYATPSSGYSQQDNYYVAGANMGVNMDIDNPRSGRAPIPSSGTAVPRAAGGQQYGAAPAYAQRDSQSSYYSPQPGQPSSVSSSQYPSNPADPYYGRAGAPVAGTYDPQDVYDGRAYPDNGAYSQAQMSSQSTTATSGSSGRTRERERDSGRDDRTRRHHR
ncbi:hypothetical protein LSUE1_G003229 [Lachnellula suecica]|uniref:Uncharacterized protein n=1 Tax=Lachnellula suecica TaxID=602035 RepID=A0A8T9CMM0_9HELO|nr:hypothetical protein LSUE1_G003229 [Lachnellula suecica]